jgi:AraC-like DNA-binding protein
MRNVARRASALERARVEFHGAIEAAIRQHHSVRAVARVAGVSASTVQRIAGKQ